MRVEEKDNVDNPLLVREPQTERDGTPQDRSSRSWMVALVAFLIVSAVVISGIAPRVKARATLRAETNQLAVPTVIVVQPKRASPGQDIVLPANVQAFKDAPIYARTNGYLKRWYADIGAHVRAAQLLAEIDTPEVDQQLHQARADLTTTEANGHLSEITANRYQGLLRSDSVSQQDADNAAGDYAAKKAIVQSAQANVRRLEDLQSFQRIYAPFEGIITARNTDIGQLIDSGSSGGPKSELFHIAAPGKLRVYVNVPQVYSRVAKPGLKADLTLAEFPGRRFAGNLVRSADAIDPASRTLLVEIEVNNPTGELLAGAYAEVHLKLPGDLSTFTIPVNTLLFRSEGLRVASVKDGKISLIPLTLGRDFGSDVEVLTGLNGDESLVVNPPDSIVSGQSVRLAANGATSPGGAK
ncbi:MAG TPA: efflux RND transporter periplasmic adaptor subunit [Terriglobales bacterium]|nr:efflux RND transporter periplasmic adaptor subunit [Terriglobales bacterium]